ncbi:DMT family transporter [Clostridiaceae bacterium 35-E11]
MEENSVKTRLYADLTLLVVAFLWGTTFVASKHALSYATPLFIIAIRFILAFIVLAVVFRKKIMVQQRSDLKGGIIVGTILYIAFVTQMIALQYTSAGKQAFLAGTYVVMAPFLYWLISKKKPDRRSFIGAVVCFVGIGLLTVNTTFRMGFGDSLTLFSSLFFAAHIISTGYFAEKQDTIILTVVQFGAVAILSLISALVFEPFPTNLALNGIVSMVYLGLFCTCIAYFLQTVAQKYTISTHAAIILSLEAVFGSILSVILLGEAFTLKMVFGCIAIFAAILITELK